MKKWLRVFIFLLSFQLEVRVKASASVLESTENCLSESTLCILKVKDESFHLKNKVIKIHASKNSILERQDEKQWKFIKGELWVESAPQIHFQTIYGDFLTHQGEFWILSEGEGKILVRNISSDVEITLRDNKKVQVPAGFQFWIAGLNSKAQSEYGMIEPIDMKKQIPLWKKLFEGSKKEFIQKMTRLHEDWGDLVEKSSAIYQDQASRKMASVEEAKNARKDQFRQQALEKERLRELYRSRVFDR